MNSVILATVAVIILGILYSCYASVISKKNKVEEAYSSIDIQLKKRHDLIPNILTIANKFMQHERDLFEEITKLRTEAQKIPNASDCIDKKMKVESELSAKLSQLMVNFENYPQLKSYSAINTAMVTYNEVEEHISAARRFYNSAVIELNNAVEIFPSSIFACLMGIGKRQFFEIPEVEKAPVNAADYLK